LHYPSLTFEELERVARDSVDPLVIELLRRATAAEDDAIELEQSLDEARAQLRESLRVEPLQRKPLPDVVIQGLAEEFNLPVDRRGLQRVIQFAREIERQHGIE